MISDREFLEGVNNMPVPLTTSEIQSCLYGADSFWLYEGRPRADKPHVKLTFGQHSDGYVNVGGTLKDWPGFRHAVAMSLISVLRQKWHGEHIAHVVGADTSSTDLAKDIAYIVGANHIRMTKVQDGGQKFQLWDDKNKVIEQGDIVLHIEELLTTSSSAIMVKNGIRKRHPGREIEYVPFLPVVVERSNPDNRVRTVEDSKVLPLLQLKIRNYDPNNCPYCIAGSRVIENPKQNWSELTGK